MARSPAEIQADIALTRAVIENQLEALSRRVPNTRWAPWLVVAFVICVVHGLTVEWEQMYVPTRYAEWRDAVNNAMGAALGLAAAWAWGIMKGTSRAD